MPTPMLAHEYPIWQGFGLPPNTETTCADVVSGSESGTFWHIESEFPVAPICQPIVDPTACDKIDSHRNIMMYCWPAVRAACPLEGCALTHDETLAAIGKIRTPIIYDAVEKFGVRARTDGLMDASIRSCLPSLGPMVGYAATGKVVGAAAPVDGEQIVPWREVWAYAERSPNPTVMVVEDVDQPPAHSCAWGDVAASIMSSLGVVGAVTNGGVRDLPEVERLGFQLFAPHPVVGHAYIRWVEIDTPVTVGSLVIRPDDLIHGDEHGVMTIPKEIQLEELLRFTIEFMASETTVIDHCRRPPIELDRLCQLMAEHDRRTGGHMQ